MQQAMIVGATMWWKKMLEKREEFFWKEGDDEEVLKIEGKKETKDEKILK